MDSREEVIFEDYLYKLSDSRAGRLHLTGRSKWKQKYFRVTKVGDKPVLDYFNKKPKNCTATPKGRIFLHPSFRIEKILNTKNRAFVFEVTSPERRICLSAEEQKTMDMFVLILQVQARLQENIAADLIRVQPENSEAMRRIGAVGTDCVLHASPWGMTLAINPSRCILAQWPIKSIRCYESSGHGVLTLESGRVAPMGEGSYIFNTQPGEDSSMYDLLDKYIMETLDRSKITRRGTDQEIEDYLHEFDLMHTLTEIKPCLLSAPHIARILRNNWNYTVPGVRTEENNNPQLNGDPTLFSQTSTVSLSSKLSRQSAGSHKQPSPPISSHSRQGSHSSANQIGEEPRLTGRPPAPPPRPVKIPHTNGAMGRPVPKPRGNNSQAAEGYMGMTSPTASKSFGSTPLSPKSPGMQEWEPPPSFNDVMNFSSLKLSASGYLSPVPDDNMNPDAIFRHRASPRMSERASDGSELGCGKSPSFEMNSGGMDMGYRNSEPTMKGYISPIISNTSYMEAQYFALASRGEGTAPTDCSYPDAQDAANQSMSSIDMKQASASCEDLSDHMKLQLYYNDIDEHDNVHTDEKDVDENMNNNKKPPMPFTQLQAFRNSADWDVRDRSKSVDYYNVLRPGIPGLSGLPGLPGLLVERSPSPSVRRIRRLMGKGNHHENLRKSVSNPNFLNVGSKEVLNYMKSNSYHASSGHTSPKLERQSRSKSRSLVDLLPGAVRRHLSHENLHRSRNNTPCHSRSATPERNKHMRENSLKNNKSLLNRQESAKSFEVSVKNIKVTDRTRSFRKVKSFDNATAGKENPEKLPRQEYTKARSVNVPLPESPQQRPLPQTVPYHHSNNGLVPNPDSLRRNQNGAFVPGHRLVNPLFTSDNQSHA